MTVTLPEDTEGPAGSGAFRKETALAKQLVTGCTAQHSAPRSGHKPPLAWLIFTDDLLFHPTVSPAAKIVLAFFNYSPDRNRPTRAKVRQSLSCFGTNHGYAAALHEIAQDRLAFVDRRLNAHGQPLRLWRTQAFADSKLTTKLVFVPTAPVAPLRGSGAKEAVLLFALYCREQRIRCGAVQLADSTAALMLGWNRKTVERARRRLEEVGAVEKVQGGSGRHGAAIYVVPDAGTGAEPNLDPTSGFDPARTRSLTLVALDETVTVPLFAHPAEAEVVSLRIGWASEETLDELRRLAERVRARRQSPWVEAKELLDGPLEGVTPPAPGSLRGRIQYVDEDGFDTSPRSDLAPELLYRTCLTSPTYAAAPRELKEKAGGDGGEGAWPENVTEAAIRAFGRKASQPRATTSTRLRSAISATFQLWGNRYGALNAAQTAHAWEQIVCALDYLRELHEPRERFAGIDRAFQHVCHDDASHERFKSLAASVDASDTEDATLIDVRHELAGLLS